MSTETSATDTVIKREKVINWIQELPFPETRENALSELSKLHKLVPDLAPMLWNSFGSIAALLQEITNIYPAISPPTLNVHQTNRLSYTLALLQCVASHPETRPHFMSAQILAYLYPLLQTSLKTPPFVLLRMISLGVIGAAVEPNEKKSINFFLNNEIIPLCLRIMASDEFELCVTAAAFIIQKILLNDAGLSFICQTYERFSHVTMVLGKLVLDLVKKPSTRLLKHVLRCYVRLAHDPRAKEALKQCLPDYLRDNTFETCLQEDKCARNWLNQLLAGLEISGRTAETKSWE